MTLAPGPPPTLIAHTGSKLTLQILPGRPINVAGRLVWRSSNHVNHALPEASHRWASRSSHSMRARIYSWLNYLDSPLNVSGLDAMNAWAYMSVHLKSAILFRTNSPSSLPICSAPKPVTLSWAALQPATRFACLTGVHGCR